MKHVYLEDLAWSSHEDSYHCTVFMSKLGVDHGSILCTDPPPLRENPEESGVCT